jgi:hypothetical protein
MSGRHTDKRLWNVMYSFPLPYSKEILDRIPAIFESLLGLSACSSSYTRCNLMRSQDSFGDDPGKSDDALLLSLHAALILSIYRINTLIKKSLFK